MSAPTRRLGNLSIADDMTPLTRAEVQRRASVTPAQLHETPTVEEESSSEEEEEEDDEDDDEEEGDEDEERSLPLIRGASTIPYDVSNLSPIARSRADAGLRGDLAVEQCRRTSSNDYEFRINERGRVRIGQTGTTCSCSEFSDGQACKHIYWLLDRIYPSVHRVPAQPAPLLLNENGSSSLMLRYVQINLEKIASDRKWTLVENRGVASESSSRSGVGMSRRDKVRDILSSLEERGLPEDFRLDIFDAMTDARQDPQSCVHNGDLQATIAHLAVSHDGFYDGLRKAMPGGARANIFFERLRQKPKDLLRTLDEYAAHGRVGNSTTPVEVGAVADGLLTYVREVNQNIEDRAPHGHRHAALLIVALFEEICNRNIDVFELSGWRREPPGESDEDRNLFHHLMIRTTEFGDLLLQILEELPNDIVLFHRQDLDAIRDRLRFVPGTQAARYARRLVDLLRRLDPSGSSPMAAPPAQPLIQTQGGPLRGLGISGGSPAASQERVLPAAGRGRAAAGSPAPLAQKRPAPGTSGGGRKRGR